MGWDGSAIGRRYGNAIAAPLLLRHHSSLEHDTGFGHPERADRIRAIEAELGPRDWLGWEQREAPEVGLDQLLAVHPQSHVDAVRELSERGGAFDLDTPLSSGSYVAALRGAGGAVALTEALVSGEAPTGFSVARPPGHHAERARAMGFCLFNTVAIAARHAIDSLGVERVLVFDPDVHHGNGTNAIFHDSAEVLFVSVHQWPFYPGSGALEDVGEGEGEGYSINLPVPARTSGDTFLSLAEHIVAPAAREFRPGLILVSAGFDAHRDDPVGGCLVDTGDYRDLARLVRALGDELGAPVGAVLEGGYGLASLAASVAATMEGLTDGGEPRSVDPDELTLAESERVSRYWAL